jgi:acyl-CoA reductase-like NAD-dependent aldehyde dehydrogenase
MDDADLDWAVDTLMDGAMFNSGQCCCGIERIYVAESLFDAFVEKSVEWASEAEARQSARPRKRRSARWPIRASPRGARADRRCRRKGARHSSIRRLFPADDGGAYLAPQILVDVNHDMEVMREESFGPVVGIMPVEDDEQAIALMNDSKYGLTASLWTAIPRAPAPSATASKPARSS